MTFDPTPGTGYASWQAVVAVICGMLGIVITLAAVAFLLAAVLLGPLAFIFALLAVILGHTASGQIRRSRGALGGRDLVITSLVLGYITLVLSIFLTILGVLVLTNIGLPL